MMVIQIDWTPTTIRLDEIHSDLMESHQWPRPRIDAAGITREERLRARADWTRRVCATYVTTGQAASILHRLMVMGAPLDIISGASYTAEEMAHHLAAAIHLLRPLEPALPLTVPDASLPAPQGEDNAAELMLRSLDLFVFNLPISRSVYTAVSAASSDPAITEIADVIADSLGEVIDFGQHAVRWIDERATKATTAGIRRRLPCQLATYESLCLGNQELLDALAGQEITIVTTAGNLGALEAQHLAAIFYDTLSSSILPALEQLGYEGLQAWQRHYRDAPTSDPIPATVAAVGLSTTA